MDFSGLLFQMWSGPTSNVVICNKDSPVFAVQIATMSIFWPFPVEGAGPGVSLRSLTCPSCHAKKVVQFGELLRENILYPLPHRQYVFSIPIILRKFFLYNRKLLSTLSKAAADSLQVFLRTVLGLKDGIFGAVLTIQTFGDYAKWHPHIHAIVADGLFRHNGVFYVMPKTSLKPLAELFRAKLLSLLVKEGVIDESFVSMLMKWNHTSGFNVDNSVRIAKDDQVGLTNLAQYIIRNPFSLTKLTYNSNTAMVTYRSGKRRLRR